MTSEINVKVNKAKLSRPDFYQEIITSCRDFKTFQNESGKNSNLNIQHIFARQLRTVKGLGAENCATITRVFKTPYLLNLCFKNCQMGER